MTIFLWLLGGIVALFLLTAFRGAPYVPSRRPDLADVFTELCPLTADDTVVDIGSGDGVVLRLAAEHGARAIGFEINPVLVVIARLISLRQPRVQTKWCDFWLTPLPAETTVVYVFGESRDIVKMAARVQVEADRIGKPLWLVSYGFMIPDLTPERTTSTHFLYRMLPKKSES